jgi:hypothetical protein
MDLPDDEKVFLRDLVKATRQRTVHVHWTDRDGTSRQTNLTPVEAARLNDIAHRLATSKGEVLRRAAFIPAAKPPSRNAPPADTSGGAQPQEQ